MRCVVMPVFSDLSVSISVMTTEWSMDSAVCFRLRLAPHRVRDAPFEPVSQCDKETVLLLFRYGWDKRPCSVAAGRCCQMLGDGHIVNQIAVLPSPFFFGYFHRIFHILGRFSAPIPLAKAFLGF